MQYEQPLCRILPRGDTYQNGVKPGSRKLEQFKAALMARATPGIKESVKGVDGLPLAMVKIFNPCGDWTWFIAEWDGDDECFGLVHGFEKELGYISLRELAYSDGGGPFKIGLEIDMHWEPKPLKECYGSDD